MKSLKISLGLLLAISACMSVNAFATDSSGAAQLETSVPPPDGPIPADQTPPISSKPTMNNNPQGAPGQVPNPPPPMTPTNGTPSTMTPPVGTSAGAPPAPVGAAGLPAGSPNAAVGTPAAPNAAAGNPTALPTAPQPAPAGTPVVR